MLTAAVHGRIEFDGTIEYEVALKADDALDLRDVRLELPLRPDAARYVMGLGWKGAPGPTVSTGRGTSRPTTRTRSGSAPSTPGLQLTLKDDRYARPLNTNFYLQKPLVLPASWGNDGKGTCRMGDEAGVPSVRLRVRGRAG